MRAVEGNLGHSLQYYGGGGEGRERKGGLAIPQVLAQCAVADSPRWTRALSETAKPGNMLLSLTIELTEGSAKSSLSKLLTVNPS